MKKYLLISSLMVLWVLCICAQSTRRDKMLKDRKEFSDRTLFQQFEQQMVPTADERKRKSEENKIKRKLLLAIIDTTQIKIELKKKLQYDVVHNPFSKRLRKFMDKHHIKERIQLPD